MFKGEEQNRIVKWYPAQGLRDVPLLYVVKTQMLTVPSGGSSPLTGVVMALQSELLYHLARLTNAFREVFNI